MPCDCINLQIITQRTKIILETQIFHSSKDFSDSSTPTFLTRLIRTARLKSIWISSVLRINMSSNFPTMFLLKLIYYECRLEPDVASRCSTRSLNRSCTTLKKFLMAIFGRTLRLKQGRNSSKHFVKYLTVENIHRH